MNTPIYNMRPRSQSAIPNVIFALLVANGIVFALQQMNARFLIINFGLWPAGVPGSPFMPWQLVTYSFLHGGIAHIFFNMYALFLFGSEIERLFGSRWFLTFYGVCVVTAALSQLIVAEVTNAPPYPTVGASGGVFGLLLAFGMYFPRRTLMLIFPPIPMPAWLFVTLYGLLELYLGVTGAAPGVAHFAHLGGMVGGFLMIQHRRGFGRRRR